MIDARGSNIKNHSEKLRFSQALFWLSIGMFFLLSLAFLLDVKPNDFWWYMRVARDTLTNGSIPQVDTLSFTHAGQPVVYHSWLSAVILYLTYQAGSLSWIVVLRVLIVAATFGVLWLLMYWTGLDPILTAGLLFFAGLATSNNWATIRPQMFALPLFILTAFSLIRWEGKDNRIIWLLPLVGLLWVNLHGSFIFLYFLAIPALIFGDGDRKPLSLALALTFILMFINPRGWGVWHYLWVEITSPNSQSVTYEWAPPVNIGWQLNIFFAWLLVFTPLAAFSKNRLSRLDWIWFLGFGWMAFSGLRYVVWFTLLLAFWSAKLLATFKFQPSNYLRLRNKNLNYFLASIFLLLPIFLMPSFRERWWEQGPPTLPDSTPVAATLWLSEHPNLPGELWSDLGFASYLTFHLPERPLWIDSRFEVVYAVADWEEYNTIANADLGWEDILRRDGVNLLVSSFENDELIANLNHTDDWCPVYQDNVANIYVRTTAAGKEACIDG